MPHVCGHTSDMTQQITATAEDRAMSQVRLGRKLRRWGLIPTAILLVWLCLSYGVRRVPDDMDTVPQIPPGAICVIARDSDIAKAGSHVFVRLPDAGVVLTQIESRDGDMIRILHPNAASRWPDSRQFGEVPARAIVGTVLSAFPSNL